MAGKPLLSFPAFLAALTLLGGAPQESAAQARLGGTLRGGAPTFEASLLSSGAPPAQEGALTLLLPTGARGVAMGRATTAATGPEAVFWNPAGLAPLTEGTFTVLRGDHLAGEATGLSLLLTRQPLGSVAVSYQILDLGDQDLRDREGNVLGTVSFRDHLAIASFGTRLVPWLDAGVNFKVFQSRIGCRGECQDAGVTGTTFVLDVGVQSTPYPALPLRLGLMLAHVGPRLQIINVEQADPLPTRIRFAAAYEILGHLTRTSGLELWLTGEVEDRWRALGAATFYVGGELLAGEEDLFFVRGGWGQGQAGQPDGIAVGLGIRYDRFQLDFARSLSGQSLLEDSEPVHVSFGIFF